MSVQDQMRELAKPFPKDFVHTNPSGGGSYVKHHVVEQRLIQVFGLPPSFEKVQVIYGDVAAIEPNPNGNSKRAKEGRPALKGVIVGVIARMTVQFADGSTRKLEEAGDCEQPHNWDSDGQRLKDAMSDAYKRCAMRLGCGLHLWSQSEYFLHDVLTRDSKSQPEQPAPTSNSEAGGAPRADESGGSKEAGAQPASKEPPSSIPSAEDAPQPNSGGGGGEGSRDLGEVTTDTPAEASSGTFLEVIAQAIKDKKVTKVKVLSRAAMVCANLSVMPENGLRGPEDVPEEAHGPLLAELGLAQKELV